MSLKTANTNRNFYGKKKRKMRANAQTKRIAKVVNQVLDQKEKHEVELKFHDINQSPGVIGGGGTIFGFTSTIAQGDTSLTREGKQITVKSLLLRYQCLYADAENLMRLIIFRYFKPGVPTVADVIQEATGTNPYLSAIKRDNTEFIRVMYDNLIALDNLAHPQQVDKLYMSLNAKCQWTEASVADYGHIWMLAIGDSNVVPSPSLQFNCRVRYTDQ